MSFSVSFSSCVFSPFSIAITSLGEERANLSAFRTFVLFVLVWICRFSLPLGVREGLRFVIVTLPGLFSYLFLTLGSSIVHSTIDPAPVLHIFSIPLQTQYRSSVYSAVHHRHSTSSPNTLHSTTVKVLVLRIHYNSLNTQHQTYV